MNIFFKDRLDAAIRLTHKLEKYKNQDGVVLAVPRGAVPMGCYMAHELKLPLDLVMTKKLGHPMNREYAIGAVSLESSFIEDRQDVPEEYIIAETQRIQEQLRERYAKFMGGSKPVTLKNKIVIIVDDGIATGRTLMAAIKMIRSRDPKKIVVAIPVAPPESAKKIIELVDEFICLYLPEQFYGVGMFYEDFSEVNDEEVSTLMRAMNGRGIVSDR